MNEKLIKVKKPLKHVTKTKRFFDPHKRWVFNPK